MIVVLGTVVLLHQRSLQVARLLAESERLVGRWKVRVAAVSSRGVKVLVGSGALVDVTARARWYGAELVFHPVGAQPRAFRWEGGRNAYFESEDGNELEVKVFLGRETLILEEVESGHEYHLRRFDGEFTLD